MSEPAATGRVGPLLLESALGALLLMIPALLNGYPLVFPDSGTYLLHAPWLLSVPDRPPYYSLLILPLHLLLSTWPIALAQAFAAAATLRGTAALLLPALSGRAYLVGIALLTALSSLPWHTGQILPDVFAGFAPLWVFALAYGSAALGRAGVVGLALSTTVAAAVHSSHLPLVAALFAAAAALRALQGFGLRDAGRVLALGGGICALTAASFVAYSVALIGRPTLSPDGAIFLLARLLDDGPALDYLRETCPASGNPFCAHLDRLDLDPAEFLWSGAAPLALLRKEIGLEAVRDAAQEIVSGSLSSRPREVATAAVHNAARQFVLFGTLDTLCPPHCAPGTLIDRAIREEFSGEYASYLESRQTRGALPIAFLRRVHSATVALAALVALGVFALALRRRERALVGLIALCAGALVANATITGVLSGPWDRYQSRVIWLVPFCALVGVAWLRSARTAR